MVLGYGACTGEPPTASAAAVSAQALRHCPPAFHSDQYFIYLFFVVHLTSMYGRTGTTAACYNVTAFPHPLPWLTTTTPAPIMAKKSTTTTTTTMATTQ